MKVEVYFNRHKKLWSVRDLKTGRVIEHVKTINILDAQFVVRPGGRAKVIRDGVKNVHAFVRGIRVDQDTIDMIGPFDVDGWTSTNVTYDPYKYSTFVSKTDETPIYTSDVVTMIGKDVIAYAI
jgi:hypothetical protein